MHRSEMSGGGCGSVSFSLLFGGSASGGDGVRHSSRQLLCGLCGGGSLLGGVLPLERDSGLLQPNCAVCGPGGGGPSTRSGG